MSFDVDEFARLYKYTGDKHYLAVAKLLLHNAKAVMAKPDRLFDLPGAGWQTEDSKYPTKDKHGNLWLPWVATAHLNGILFLEQFDPVLFKNCVDKMQSVLLVCHNDGASAYLDTKKWDQEIIEAMMGNRNFITEKP